MHGTDWLPGIVVLSIGLLGGLVVAWRLLRGAPAAASTGGASVPDDLTVRDLAARRDALVHQLRELEDTAGKLPPEELATQRWDLELEAAVVLRDLDRAVAARGSPAAAAPAPAAPAPPAGWAAKHPGLVGALSGLAAAAFVLGLNSLLGANTGERIEGGTMTGNTEPPGARPPMGPGRKPAAPEAAEPDPELDELRASVAAHPDSIELKLELAQLLVFKDQLVEAFGVAQQVLEKEPDNPRALTYSAVVRQAMGQGELALSLTAKAVEKDPALVEAWFHRGLIAYQQEKFDVAVQAWEKALALRPDGQKVIGRILEDAKKRAGGWKPPPEPAAAAAMPPGPAPAVASGTGVAGTVVLGEGAAAPPGAVLFLYARADGVRAGPPAAVRRIERPAFPFAFTLGPEHAMIAGMPWPERVSVEARLDRDGVATTKEPGEPAARQEGVAAGATGLILTLQ